MAKWYVSAKKADFAAIGAKFGIDQVTARIIRNRGVIGDDAVNEFLNGKISDIADPALLKDGQRLVDILVQKIADKAKIRIIGDYDIDGVMSTYILVKALKRAGACVDYMIPDRVKDGYGLNVHLIDKAYEDGIDTVVTCDNGIAAIEEIAHAKELKMTVLVTDHHAVPFEDIKGIKIYKESKADAIVNPHQIECSYPYKELCGAAVAWKIVILLYRKIGIDEKEAMDFIENVAFATVGDVMPLTGENRILVKAGLKSIHHTTNIGMKALLECCNIEAENVDAYHFGFVLGPCVNATGRLDTAKRALELFLCDRQEDAMRIASELVALNDDRKEMTAKGVETAVEIYERDNYEKDRVLVIYLPDVHESIAGIIAGRIREKYNKPTFILTKSEDGVKGSGRSIEEYSMYEEMCKCSELFTKFGGHPMAAGLSLPQENVEPFRQKINEYASLTDDDLVPKIHIDVPMPVGYVSMRLVSEFSVLAPFGKDNPKPVFADKNLRVSRMWVVGKNNNVLRLSLISSYGMPINAIYFGDIESFFDYIRQRFGSNALEAAQRGRFNNIVLSVVYSPKINVFRENESLQFEIQYYK